MSSSIWTRCGGGSNRKRLALRAFRAVEAQHRISTRKLTDSDAEQVLLEELLEGSKPAAAPDLEGLHYLLLTPFRYPPLRHGSRFGVKTERGIWYGSRTLPTCFAEVAYYRLVFLEGTTADLSPLLAELTSFQAAIRTARGVELMSEPFRTYRSRIASPSRYESAQKLGRDMRADGVEAVRYPSARDRGGVNVAVFSPRAFARRVPEKLETWLCVATKERVEFSRKDFLRERESIVYERALFEVKGRLPAPAV
ncbi:MAG: RES family NAD+ phosphorylase [Acidobacteriota bacterium]|nr:MAG: RES family NAD+ phosphorylase [Acidobacteriota bacterium]